jgi:hypothetical protein
LRLGGWTGAGFFYWDALLAQGAEVGGPSGYFEGRQGNFGDSQVGFSAAAVDDGRGAQHLYASGLQRLDHVPGAASGGDDIFNDDGGFAGFDCKAPAEDHFAGGRVSLSEQETGSQCSRDFMADDQAADGWGDDDIDFREVRGQLAAEFLGYRWVLEDQGALHVLVRMKAAGEAEMTF